MPSKMQIAADRTQMFCKLLGKTIFLLLIFLFSRANVWLGGKRMFFGLDMSHAPPLSLYARQRGEEPANPTVIGVSKYY